MEKFVDFLPDWAALMLILSWIAIVILVICIGFVVRFERDKSGIIRIYLSVKGVRRVIRRPLPPGPPPAE